MFANLVPVPPVPPTIIIDIELSHNSKKYFPGETVKGKVVFQTTEPISARFLKISWKGETKCEFGSCMEKEHLSNYIIPWIAENGNDEIGIGVHKYRFNFRIPNDAPPSSTGTYGSTSYAVQVEFDRPWKWNMETKKTFYVVPKMCMAESAPEMFDSAKFVMHKNSGTLIKDGLFSIKLDFPKRAFMPGETIETMVTMENHSSKPITSLQFELIRQSHYHAQPQNAFCSLKDCLKNCPVPPKYTRNEENVLKTGVYLCNVLPGETKQVTVEIDLPRGIPATFESSMISMGYLVGFSLKNGSWTNNKLECNARIVIGNEEKIDGTNEKKMPGIHPPPPYSP